MLTRVSGWDSREVGVAGGGERPLERSKDPRSSGCGAFTRTSALSGRPGAWSPSVVTWLLCERPALRPFGEQTFRNKGRKEDCPVSPGERGGY